MLAKPSARNQALLGAVIGLLSVAGVVLLTPAPPLNYSLAFTFFVAVFLVDLLDLRMPYGDLMPVDSPLVVACLLLPNGGPITALVSAAGARLAVHVARNGLGNLAELSDVLSRRLLVIFASSLLLGMLNGMGLGLTFVSIVVSVVFVALDLVIAQLQSIARIGEAFLQLLVGNLVLQWPLLASQVSVAILAVFIFEDMQEWGLVLVFLLVFLMRQSLALLLEIRQAYRSTIEALVASIEIQDTRRRGHAERVESIAHSVGLRLGLRGRDLENLGYAALLHDVDLIGVDEEEWPEAYATGRHAAEIVKDVHFLRHVIPVLRICDGATPTPPTSRTALLSACVVVVASEIDDTQTGAVATLPGDSLSRLSPSADPAMVREVSDAAAALGLWPEGTTPS